MKTYYNIFIFWLCAPFCSISMKRRLACSSESRICWSLGGMSAAAWHRSARLGSVRMDRRISRSSVCFLSNSFTQASIHANVSPGQKRNKNCIKKYWLIHYSANMSPDHKLSKNHSKKAWIIPIGRFNTTKSSS